MIRKSKMVIQRDLRWGNLPKGQRRYDFLGHISSSSRDESISFLCSIVLYGGGSVFRFSGGVYH